MMKLTPKKQFMDHGMKHEIQAKYGIDYDFARRSNQAPYFSMTASIWVYRHGRWEDDGSGMQHEEIARHFPELAGYLKWHLMSTREPMHYIANAQYWWEVMVDKRPPDKYQRISGEDALKQTIIYGAVPGDLDRNLRIPWAILRSWLEKRLPELMGYFMADMTTLGVLE